MLLRNRLEFGGMQLATFPVYDLASKWWKNVCFTLTRKYNMAAGIMDVRLEFEVKSGILISRNENLTMHRIFMQFSVAKQQNIDVNIPNTYEYFLLPVIQDGGR